jgi:hypothetical protein
MTTSERERRSGAPIRTKLAALATTLGLVASCVAISVGARPGGAVGDGWAVEPSSPTGTDGRDYFAYTLKPGQGFEDTVRISNFTDQDLDFRIYPRDAFNTTGDGGFAVQEEDEQPRGVGSWIRLPDEVGDRTIEAGSAIDVPFAITVPPDAEPGDHAGAIIAALMSPEQVADAGVGIDVRQRVGSRMYVRVDGPIDPALAITRLDVASTNPFLQLFSGRGSTTVTYEVTNVGNARLAPQTALRVEGPFGVVVGEANFRQLPELLPGGSVVVTDSIDGIPPLGPMSVVVSAETIGGNATETTRSMTYWAVPWLWLLILALAAGLLVWYRWRNRPPAEDPVPSRPTEPRVPAGV